MVAQALPNRTRAHDDWVFPDSLKRSDSYSLDTNRKYGSQWVGEAAVETAA
jgi:hypothetical protein